MHEDEEMADVKVQILEDKRDFLCKNLNPKSYFPYLRSASVISDDDEEQIMALVTRRQKCEKFLDILKLKGPRAYEGLLRALLNDRTQMFIVTELNKEYERRKKSAMLNGTAPSLNIDLAVDTSTLPKPTPRVAVEHATTPTYVKLHDDSEA